MRRTTRRAQQARAQLLALAEQLTRVDALISRNHKQIRQKTRHERRLQAVKRCLQIAMVRAEQAVQEVRL